MAHANRPEAMSFLLKRKTQQKRKPKASTPVMNLNTIVFDWSSSQFDNGTGINK